MYKLIPSNIYYNVDEYKWYTYRYIVYYWTMSDKSDINTFVTDNISVQNLTTKLRAIYNSSDAIITYVSNT